MSDTIRSGTIGHGHADSRVQARDLQLPSSNASNIHVNELRPGIIPHSSAVKGESDIAKFRRRYPRYADVNSLALHVQTVKSHAG
jgi:hypothetical protein